MNAAKSQKLPKFRIHKATGQAYVELPGKRFYLGRHDSPGAQQRYHALVAEWLANGRQLRLDPKQITIKEMLARYWVYGERYYRNASGTVSRELENIRLALRLAAEVFASLETQPSGSVPAAEHGKTPRHDDVRDRPGR